MSEDCRRTFARCATCFLFTGAFLGDIATAFQKD
jgi:hypothetical protein